MTIGLYDPTGLVAAQISDFIGDKLVVVPPALIGEVSDAGLAHLYDKELLLKQSNQVIINMVDLASLSMLTGALRLLLDGTLERVMAIGPVPLPLLLKAAEDDGTELLLKEDMNNGRFTIAEQPDPKAIKSFLAGAKP